MWGLTVVSRSPFELFVAELCCFIRQAMTMEMGVGGGVDEASIHCNAVVLTKHLLVY